MTSAENTSASLQSESSATMEKHQKSESSDSAQSGSSETMEKHQKSVRNESAQSGSPATMKKHPKSERNKSAQSGSPATMKKHPKSERNESAQSGSPATMKKHPKSERNESAQSGSPATMKKHPKPKGLLFSYESKIILMEELLTFRQQFGAVNKWRLFHERSQLKHKYTDSQIAELMRRFKRNFVMNRRPPPPSADPKQIRFFELSKALWGSNSDPQQGSEFAAAAAVAVVAATGHKRKSSGEQQSRGVPINSKEFPLLSKCFENVKVPELLRRHWGLMGSEAALDFEQQLKKLKKAKLSLCLEKICLKKDMCLMLSEIIHRDVLAVQSSSPKEKEVKKEGSCQGTNLNSDIVLFNDNLVTQKSDSQSNKKRSSRKKKKDPKGKRVDVQTLVPSQVEIEELAMGDPNGKMAALGMKVKVRFDGKLKDSGQVFESTGKASHTISLGYEEMIEGFVIGVDGMRVGGKRKLIIPPSLGFGEEGFNDVVPPNSWLEYEIEMIDILN